MATSVAIDGHGFLNEDASFIALEVRPGTLA
jgi:hypothetical protein